MTILLMMMSGKHGTLKGLHLVDHLKVQAVDEQSASVLVVIAKGPSILL